MSSIFFGWAIGFAICWLLIKLVKLMKSPKNREPVAATPVPEGPVRLKNRPISPTESMTLDNLQIQRLDYMIEWTNDQLKKEINGNTRSFYHFYQIDKSIHQPLECLRELAQLFRESGWKVEEEINGSCLRLNFTLPPEAKQPRLRPDEHVRISVQPEASDKVQKEAEQEVEELLGGKYPIPAPPVMRPR